MASNERLQSTEWKWIRSEVIIRDGYECQECGALGGRKGGTELHVHHIELVQNGGKHELDNLTTLCAECHISKHSSDNKEAETDCISPTTARERDEDTGQYVPDHSTEYFLEAIRELGRDAGTQAIADEVSCGYDSAYKRLSRLQDRDVVTSRKIGNARLWEVDEEDNE